MFKQMGRTSQTVLIILYVLMDVKAFEMEITPADRVVERIGATLILTCNTTGCALPKFSWRTQMDYPLGGKVYNNKTHSTLTMNPVSAENYNDYLCTVICNKEKKEKSVKVELYFGPQNTSINASPGNSLMEGHFLKLTCMTDSNPPAQVFWRKHLAKETIQHFIENSVLSIPHAHFTDSGQYICEVVNPVTNKTEKATTNIVIQAPPKNASLMVFPSSSVKEGESVTISCSATGVPAVQIILEKKIGDVVTTLKTEDGKYTIDKVQPEDAGKYECTFTNKFGNHSLDVELDVKVPPQNITVLVYPSENVKEGENVTIMCSTYSNPPSQMILKKVNQDEEIILPAVNGTFTLYNVTKNDTGRYLLDVFNEVGNNIKVIEIAVVGKLEKPDQIMPLMIALSCVTAIAIPVVAILIYVSRKAKINGSYSLVKALRLKV
ncbi:vascular cell adhesion protein 1 isoform X2 [Gallus gallus]|uniref:vascular cell adhesion protein 1 isoform X2 n=1 Tax=Gallus gallus TaxID=9031 RepID=UPI0003504E8F|nr:vascular cell adhesion protein 1 isoform X2 [Gallus gallus]XP_040533685.1 vascular cell adhesion protein 1 isoform X2 [Gallus gallus]|eukprot:XP_004936608.1 vascular cell adhesion protein 1 isoform X2 [Gallus gallus]